MAWAAAAWLTAWAAAWAAAWAVAWAAAWATVGAAVDGGGRDCEDGGVGGVVCGVHGGHVRRLAGAVGSGGPSASSSRPHVRLQSTHISTSVVPSSVVTPRAIHHTSSITNTLPMALRHHVNVDASDGKSQTKTPDMVIAYRLSVYASTRLY